MVETGEDGQPNNVAKARSLELQNAEVKRYRHNTHENYNVVYIPPYSSIGSPCLF